MVPTTCYVDFHRGSQCSGQHLAPPGALPGIPVSSAFLFILFREDISHLLREEETASCWPGRLGESLFLTDLPPALFFSSPTLTLAFGGSCCY